MELIQDVASHFKAIDTKETVQELAPLYRYIFNCDLLTADIFYHSLVNMSFRLNQTFILFNHITLLISTTFGKQGPNLQHLY